MPELMANAVADRVPGRGEMTISFPARVTTTTSRVNDDEFSSAHHAPVVFAAPLGQPVLRRVPVFRNGEERAGAGDT